MPALLTVGEIAATLRVDTSTVYRWFARGVLPCVRFGGSVRVRPDELERFVRQGGDAA